MFPIIINLVEKYALNISMVHTNTWITRCLHQEQFRVFFFPSVRSILLFAKFSDSVDWCCYPCLLFIIEKIEFSFRFFFCVWRSDLIKLLICQTWLVLERTSMTKRKKWKKKRNNVEHLNKEKNKLSIRPWLVKAIC